MARATDTGIRRLRPTTRGGRTVPGATTPGTAATAKRTGPRGKRTSRTATRAPVAIRPAAERIRDSHRIRLLLANDAWQAIGYQLGVVELIRTNQESRVIGQLGPDLLGPDWDCAEAVRRLSAEPDRPVGEALLDQCNLAGIGNVYKAEVLFLRGLSPWQPAGRVTDLGALAELARRLLEANKERFGHITTGSMRRGEEHWVYGRRGKPCRRCGTPVRAAGQDDRVTFWCPSCQPG